MCLAGQMEQDGGVNVITLKDMSWWELASGIKCDTMASQAQALCSTDAPSADVARLPSFHTQAAIDYTGVPATLSACSLLDLKRKQPALVGDATEHLYQLNHVYVPAATKADSILHDDRLFAVLECWDYSQKIALAFRGKAMLQLARLPQGGDQEYKDAHANGELRHPLLASLRVRIKKKEQAPSSQGSDATEHSQPSNENALSAIVVEAEPVDAKSMEEIPNDSVEAIHGLLAAGPAPTSERLAAAPLRDLKPSPFYNMVANGDPRGKALVLLRFTQRSVGKHISNGFRLVTDNVQDACDPVTPSR